jgi:hypothetical protein
MLEGVRDSSIIVGAYTDRSGGVCPMLAAHRRGGRTSLASFARAWDRYTGANGRPRRATPRELKTLTAMLEASVLSAEGDTDLGAAVAEHRSLRAEREQADRPGTANAEFVTPEFDDPDPGDRDRTAELAPRPGWAWLRVFRRHDEYEAALAQLGESTDGSAVSPERSEDGAGETHAPERAQG